MVDTLQWTRLHPDYLHRIKVSQCDAYLELCTREGYAHVGRPLSLPESAVTSSKVQNGIYKAVVGVSPDSFVACQSVS